MDAEWGPDRITELVRLELILPGEDLDPIYLLEDALNRKRSDAVC
jgi:hypothetical protein